MIDANGFTIHTCSECHTPKMAALFTPQEIAGAMRCRVCTGEMKRLNGKGRKPTDAQQPRMTFHSPGQVAMRDAR